MTMASFPQVLIAVSIYLSSGPFSVFGDTHETLAKRSLSGKPYYVIEGPQIADIYDTVYPVVFEFTTPNWSHPINLIGYTCKGDDYDNDGWSCPVLWYWLTGIRDKLQEEIYVENMKVRDMSNFSTEFNCDEIREVFEGLYLDEARKAQFFEFLTSVTNCQYLQTTILPRSDKYLANTIDETYRTMRVKFFEEYYTLQTPVNRSNDAMYTNARYNYYSSGLFEYYIESRRWTEALTACKSGRIPNSLIPSETLLQVITDVGNNASINNMELAIGTDKISRYYKSESLIDCAFTPDSLIVVLQVPVKVTGQSFQDVSFLSVPYYNDNRQNEICQIDFGESRKSFIKNAASNALLIPNNVRCNAAGFCTIHSNLDQGLVRKSCPEALLLDEDDSKTCSLSCQSKDMFHLPMITQVADDRVLIFGSDPKTMEVKIVCPDFQNKMEAVDSSEAAFEITIPCGCEIHKDGRSIFKANGKCDSEVHVIKV